MGNLRPQKCSFPWIQSYWTQCSTFLISSANNSFFVNCTIISLPLWGTFILSISVTLKVVLTHALKVPSSKQNALNSLTGPQMLWFLDVLILASTPGVSGLRYDLHRYWRHPRFVPADSGALSLALSRSFSAVCLCCSVMGDSFGPCGLCPTRLLCP